MSNFLDLRCPRCGDQDEIDILAEVWLRATADGTDADASADGNHVFTPKSATRCDACGHSAPLAHFDTDQGSP